MKLLRSIIPQTKNYKKLKKQRLSDKKHNSDYTGARVGWMDAIRITAHKIKQQQQK